LSRLKQSEASRRAMWAKRNFIQKSQDENVHESISSITRMFPEGSKVKSLGKEMSDHGGNYPEKYEVQLKGGALVGNGGDFDRLQKAGIDVGSIQARDGNIVFEAEIPKHLARSSPLKINKVAFGMRNLGLPHIKQGYHTISSGNSNETEQEKLKLISKYKKLGVDNKDMHYMPKIAEIDRMANPHTVKLTPSPFPKTYVQSPTLVNVLEEKKPKLFYTGTGNI